MNTEFEKFYFDLPKNQSNVIKVVGVGGGGSNAINYMFQSGINGVDFVVCNTDAQALENSPVPNKIQLGVSLTEGLGAGANPEIGEQAAIESFDDLKIMLETNTKMLFITAGMGGGTGTGAAPIIAELAKEMDILTVGIVTTPFQFEGRMRNEQSQKGVENLRKNVDSLIVINNNKLREVYGNLGFKAGFSKADEVLATAARGIAEVITHHYTQNIDLRDTKTVLANSGTAIMGSATASGTERSKEVIIKALDSPLLNDNKITGAKNVLLLIVSGAEEITIDEIGEINDYIQNEAGTNTNIIMGVGEDKNLGEAIAVTVIATGFAAEQQHKIVNTEAKKIIHTLEEDQRITQQLSPQKKSETEPLKKEIRQSKRIVHPLEEQEISKHFTYKKSSKNIRQNEFNPKEIEEKHIVKESLKNTPIADEKEVKPFLKNSNLFHLPNKSEKSKEKDTTEINKNSNTKQNKTWHLLEKDTDLEEIVAPPTIAKEKSVVDKELLFKTKTVIASEKKNSSNIPQKEKNLEEKLDPTNSSIAAMLKSRAEERKRKIKELTHKFHKNFPIDEIEKEPAYKRMGIDVSGNSDSKESKNPKNTTEDKKDINNEIG